MDEVTTTRTKGADNSPLDPTELLEEYGTDALMDSVVPTKCPEGCMVEPDGKCPHGAESVLLRAGLI